MLATRKQYIANESESSSIEEEDEESVSEHSEGEDDEAAQDEDDELHNQTDAMNDVSQVLDEVDTEDESSMAPLKEAESISDREKASSTVDDEFAVEEGKKREMEDEEMEAEMEGEEPSDSDEAEMDGLAADADLPIEELLRRSGYLQDESMEDDDSALRPESNAIVEHIVNGHHEDTAFSIEDGDEEFLAPSEDPENSVDLALEAEMEAEESNASSDSEMNGLNGDVDKPLAELLGDYDPSTYVEDYDDGSQQEQMEGESTKNESDEVTSKSGDEEEDLDSSRSVTTSETSEDHLKVRLPFLLRGTLRPYQRTGLEWLAGLYEDGHNGILADEMASFNCCSISNCNDLLYLFRVWGT